jgi:hypothetical protein
MFADQMLPRAPQLVPAFVDGFPKLPASLSMLGDVPTASTASLAIGDGSITLHSQSVDGSGANEKRGAIDEQRRGAFNSNDRSPEAEIRFQEALKRLDNVATRKAEAAERAVRIGWRQNKITEYPNTRHVDVDASDSSKFPLARVEEDISGRKVEDYHTNYPYISKRVVEDPDGKMTTTTVKAYGEEGHRELTTNSIIEHSNGDLEHTTVYEREIDGKKYKHNEKGQIEKSDGSVVSWHDDNTEDGGMAYTYEYTDGHVYRPKYDIRGRRHGDDD